MARYTPPFHDPQVGVLARGRGMLAEGESITDGIRRVAGCLADIDRTLHSASGEPADGFAGELLDAMLAGQIAPSSQLFSAAGRSSAVAACTVLPVSGTTDASRVERVIAAATVASGLGLGCGMDLTAMDDPAAALSQINANLLGVHHDLLARDRRPPALMVTCESSHPEIGAFIGAKRGADFASWVTNISVRVRGDDASWPALRAELAASAHHNGEPGVLFQEEADRDNPTPDIEMVSTAPCAEVFLSPGERCVFMTVNLAAHVHDGGFDWAGFRRSVALAVRAGDAAVELAAVDASPVVADRRRIGVGVCGFHTALIMLGVAYADGGAFARSLAEDLTFTAHSASTDLAAARGPFPIWHSSRWRDPSWLRRKADRRTGTIAEAAWEDLHQRQLQVGVRHAAIVAYPPTGVIAGVLGVSRSYEPHFTLVGRTGTASRAQMTIVPEALDVLRHRADGERALELLLDPSSDHQLPEVGVDDVLACARQLPPSVHLDVHAAFSGLADESGSKTVNLPATATVADVEALLERARTLGLKGITVFREGCLDTSGAAA